ncbi:BglG family transcription antiterminator [Caldanaerobacter subterraneus]|uniref:Lichenan operon transcriptional antiterminator n=1 Tax=Caldanaerobacter subterraneus TaxID=911092 RepID=A0A4R2K6Y7_9THEO|nr:BglG family transcription antiterminator [Caldanaerobacter subterraneus]TCO67627.1 lichenan operon transcriptional antiterminator [Caldanaerobacter subterraneus]
MLNSREKKILKVLKEAKEPVTVSDLSAVTGVTTRTVKKDIEILKLKLDRNKVEIITKPGVGVWLEEKDNSGYLENVLGAFSEVKNPVFPEDRVYYIAKRLLETNGWMSLEDLSVELYVSKSTVAKDLSKVEEFLKKYGLKVEKRPRYGIKVKGDEKNIRLANAEILKNITAKHSEIVDGTLKELLDDIDLLAIQKIIQEIEEEYDFILSDISFKGLLIHLAISLKRLQEGKKVEMEGEDLDLLKKEKEWEIAEQLVKKVEKRFGVTMDEAEVGYIAMHLMGAKLQSDIETEKLGEDYLKKVDYKLYVVMNAIVKDLSDVFGFDFYKDKKLLTGLFLHLRPAINRLKNGIKLANPLLEEIKKECNVAFEVAISFWQRLQKFYEIEPGEDEIGYVAIHFGASIERLKENAGSRKTAIIVCASGIGTAQFLAARLQKIFPEIELLKVLSLGKAKRMLDELSPDIVLTTVPFETKKYNVVSVSPFLEEKDVEKISRFLRSEIREKAQQRKWKILDYIESDLSIFQVKVKSKGEIILKLSEKLKEKGYVKDGFYESVIERESFSSTAIGNYVAIPHPYSGFVTVPKIAVAVLDAPIKWDEAKKVQLIFLIGLDLSVKEDFKMIFEELSDVVENESKVQKLLKCRSFEEFVRIFRA